MARGKPKGAKDISFEDMQAVITLRHIEGMTFKRIQEKTGVPERTASNIYKRARDLVEDSSLKGLLHIVQTTSHPGAPIRVPNGSELSKSMRRSIIIYEEESFQEASNRVINNLPSRKALSENSNSKLPRP